MSEQLSTMHLSTLVHAFYVVKLFVKTGHFFPFKILHRSLHYNAAQISIQTGKYHSNFKAGPTVTLRRDCD